MNKKCLYALLALSVTFVWDAHAKDAKKDVLGDIRFSESPFEACQDAAMLKKSDYEKNKAFWDRAINECGAKVQVLPDTGFFNTMISKLGESDENTRSAAFLEKVGERAKFYVQTNNKITETLIRCAKNDKDWFAEKLSQATGNDKMLYKMENCGKLTKLVRSTMDGIAPEMRLLVALSRYQDTMPHYHETGPAMEQKNARNNLNIYMGAAPGILVPKMDKLTEAEIEKAAKVFDQDSKEFDKEFLELKARHKAIYEQMVKEDGNDFRARTAFPRYSEYKEQNRFNTKEYQDFLMRKRQDKQLEYRQRYMQLLAKAPVFAYIGGKNYSDKDLAAAAEKVLKNGKEELETIQSALDDARKVTHTRSGDISKSDEKKAKAMFHFMKYGPVVNELVKEDPSQCKVATGIAHYIANTELRNNVALMAGMLGGVGFVALRGSALVAGTALAGFSNAALATFAALPVSASLYYKDYRNYVEAERRVFNVLETENTGTSIATLEDYMQARDALTMSIAMAGTGMDFWGMGLTKGTLAMTAAGAAGRLGARTAARAAIIRTLESKGMAKAEVETLLKTLAGSDAKAAGKAAATVIDKLGLDKNEIRLMRLLGERGFLKPAHNKAFEEAFQQQLAHLSARERQRVVQDALAVMEHINPAKLNDMNRAKVLEAMMAGSQFGVNDPKRLAGIINDWDQGIEGLTKTFQVAQSKMNLKEVARIGNVEERQAKAFSLALDELMEANPEFKAMKASERQAAKSQMGMCAIGRN